MSHSVLIHSLLHNFFGFVLFLSSNLHHVIVPKFEEQTMVFKTTGSKCGQDGTVTP